jgi:hypothetical protein
LAGFSTIVGFAMAAIATVAKLIAALNAAQPGAVLELAPGVYDGVAVVERRFSTPVTITSADPARPAVLTGLKVADSSGLNFSNLEFSFAAAADEKGTNALGIKVQGSSDIHFRNDSIHGTLDDNPSNDIVGLSFKQVSNVSVENSEFQQLRMGIAEGKSTGVTITGNNFHDIRIDGIDNTASTNVVIAGNNFSNFRHTAGDHSDAIQFFTYGQTVISSDITISDNVIVQGQGEVMQGVWINDEVGNLPFEDVRIENNFVVGGNWNSIAVRNGRNAVVRGNTVTALSSQSQTPAIKMVNVDGLELVGNAAPMISTKGSRVHRESANRTNGFASDGGRKILSAWLVQRPRKVAPGPASADELVGRPARR